jgi:glycosyltransferase involved in cell wall biosynthesis
MPWFFLWQRPHQIAARLASRGNKVLYFQNPIFLHPTIIVKRSTKNTISKKIEVTENLHVTNLFLLPFLGKLRVISEKLGLLLFKLQLRRCGFKPDVAIFYSYTYVFLLETLKSMNVKIIYDCIDDFSSFSDVSDISKVLEEEKTLITESSFVVATSKPLLKKISKINPKCLYVPNAADFNHIHEAVKVGEIPREIKNLNHPIIGFIGAVRDWIDVDLICKLADLHPGYSFLLIGPVNFGLEKLEKHSNIKLVGAKSYRVLPRYLACMDVCLIPFKINKLTLASNPIKLYEYLAAGKPVVSTALPEVCENASGLVYIARDEEDFIRKVEEAVKEAESPNKELIMRRINFAKENSWEKRIETIEKLLKNIFKSR